MRPVELMEVLEARERRVRRQQELLDQFGKPLVCFTMNIAGPVKNSDLIAWGFRHGCGRLKQQLERVKARVLHQEVRSEVTGNEAFYVVDLNPGKLKALMVELEEGLELGRLYDLDVLGPDGRKMERMQQRCCIICGAPGKACARSRAHSVEALQEKTNALLRTARLRWEREKLGELACRALLYEACTTPKPGLVDRNNSGSHGDMDLFTFLSSTSALQPYFIKCAAIGQQTALRPPAETFAALRWPGKEAELRMLEATGGINTHKGAIFTLGVLCGAMGRLGYTSWSDKAAVLRECAAMTRGLTQRELHTGPAQTAGEKQYLRYGITGVRGQIEAGLPTVLQYGLPILEAGISKGKSLEEAGCAALLSLIAHTEDTNLIHRGGLAAQEWASVQAAALLAQSPDPSAESLRALDDAFIAKNLSPGGCADLLAVCYFLHFLKT